MSVQEGNDECILSFESEDGAAAFEAGLLGKVPSLVCSTPASVPDPITFTTTEKVNKDRSESECGSTDQSEKDEGSAEKLNEGDSDVEKLNEGDSDVRVTFSDVLPRGSQKHDVALSDPESSTSSMVDFHDVEQIERLPVKQLRIQLSKRGLAQNGKRQGDVVPMCNSFEEASK